MLGGSGPPTKMQDISEEKVHRILTGTREFDRVLGKGLAQGSIILIGGEPGKGKSLENNEPVLTPHGWVPIGKLKKGDLVIGAEGWATVVIGVYPQGNLPTYEVKTSDGGAVLCSKDHLWSTRTRKQRLKGESPSVRTTEEIAKTLHRSDKGLNHSIPFAKPARFNAEKPLKLHPYLLGVYLADGCCGESNPSPLFTNPEADVVERIIATLPEGDVLVSARPDLTWRVKRKTRNNQKCETSVLLRELGLFDKDSFHKFIPEEYLRASIDQRKQLLQGILDGDGHVKDVGTNIEYTTVSKQLAGGVVELVRSLGGRTTEATRKTRFTTTKGKKKFGAKSWRIQISFANEILPVSSKKHLSRYKRVVRLKERFIKSVKPVGNKPCTCIRVAATDGLFITRDYLVTHNSTLALQVGCELADALEDPCKVLYQSGEETPAQIRQRGDRIAPKMSNIMLYNETELEKTKQHVLEFNPDIWIIDSIQTMRAPGMEEVRSGTVTQVQESTAFITGISKARDITTIIIGHVNKDGDIAGPKTLEHLVDTVLNFDAERSSDIRVLSALKNRYGPTSEVGVFRMGPDGLVSVDNPSEHILRGKKAGPGSALTAAMMKAGAGAGSRATILEVQCLVSPSRSNSPKRVIEGYDRNRLEMVLAVLGKHTDFGALASNDLYINLGGGYKVEENALDTPVMLALVSDFLRKPLLPGCVAWGEIGLTGEIRPEESTDKRLAICDAMKIKVERRLFSDSDNRLSIGEALRMAGMVAEVSESPPADEKVK